jgi:hypothetical protein
MTARVSVHWNLRRAGFVLGTPGTSRLSKPRKVRDTTETVCLTDATFVVSEAGREYCRAKHGRWVHAWVTGVPCGCGAGDGESVTYNPFRDTGFRTVAGAVVEHAAHVRFRIVNGKPETRVRL